MKNTAIIRIMTMLLICGGVGTQLHGQYADLYYHRVGDTIEQTPNNGYFAWWRWDDAIMDQAVVGCYGNISNEPIVLVRYTTTEPLRIVGLAGSPISTGNQPQTVFTSYNVCHRQEYFCLYDARPNGDTLLGRVPWNLADTGRRLHIHSNGYGPGGNRAVDDSCCAYSPWQRTFKLLEYYFDSAIVVTDSFYVGGTAFSGSSFNTESFLYDTTITSYMTAHWFSLYGCKGGFMEFDCYNDTVMHKCYPAINTGVLDTVTWSQGWRYRPLYSMLMVYPIIEVDTTLPPPELCPEMTGFDVTALTSTCLSVTWNDYPNYATVEVAHGPIAVAQDEWTVSCASGGIYNICNIDTTCGHYGIKLRAICPSAHDTTEWTQVTWFDVANMRGPAGVHTSIDLLTRLTPNPTTGKVNISSQYPLSRLEIYNGSGMLVYSEPLPTLGGEVDLSMLTDGVYIAIVRTLRGTTAKKFVISKE